MKLKRVISFVLIGLFTSLFQGMPVANAAVPSGVSNSTSCSSGNATVSFSVSSNGGLAITSWEYSFDGSDYATIPLATGNSGSYSVTSWYSSSFAPYIRARNSEGVSLAARNSSCGSITGRTSYTPTVLAANAPTGNAGSGQVLTSALTFNSQAVAIVKTYKWQRCSDSGASNCVDIAGATSATYTAGASDAGMYLRTLVTGTSTVGGVSQSTVGTSALTAQISEAAPGTPGTPTAVAGDEQATITVVAPSSGGSPASYTVTALDSSGNVLSPSQTCTVTGASGSCVITGLTNGTAYKFSSTATNGAGTSSASAASLSVTPTTPPPSITNVTSSTANGSYKAGQTISVQVVFDQAVAVTGTPKLTLETGSVDQVVNYTSGSGTNTLTFDYIIQAGDTSSDLTYFATNALALSGGTIKNSLTLDAVLTLSSPTATGSLGANKAIVVDTTAPSTPATPDLDTASDTGSSSTDNITSDSTPTISVSGVFSGTAVVTATKSGSTSVSCTISSNGCTLATLSDGTWDISVTDTDAAGNATTSTAFSITVDTTAPTAGLTTGSILSSENAAVTSSAVGTAYLVNNSITVTNLASITGAADASWNSVAITTANTATNLAATGLTPGTYRLYTVDAAGNLSLVSSDSVTVTLAATGTPDLVSTSDLGSSSTDNTTNDDTPEISLSGLTVGAVITLTATPTTGTAVVCTFTATATTGSCPFTTLGNGTYSVAATQTFNSVTSSASTALTGLVINKLTIPTPSTPDLDTTSDTGGSATDNITSDNTPTISVAGSFTGTAVVTATKQAATSVLCTIATNTCDLTLLSDGTWSISVTDTDSAGNSTTSAALSITVDATAPSPTVAATSVTTASGVTVRSSEIGTAYLVKTTVNVTNLASITSAADDSMNQVTIAAAGTNTTMSTAGLIAGDYKLYVVDAAGNVSLASTNTVTVAVAAAPTATSTSAPTGTTTFGSTLTNAVTFGGVPTPSELTYQWKSCTSATDTTTACTDISGATASSFIASAIELVGKFIRVLVTAINGISPNGSELSSPTAAITPVAPGVPVVGTPTWGDLQIIVPVTAPASNGGSTIIKYQFSTDGGTTWMDRTDTATVSSPIVIKFLSSDGTTPIVAGTTYPVQIRAVNGATPANSDGSASISVTAITTPGAPTSVSAAATGQTTATVSFTAPANNGGSAITTFTVTSSPGGITATGSTSPITVSGLTASTSYTFTVTANNGTLTSAASAPSTAITTSSPPPPPPPPACDAACVAAAAKVISDKIASDTAAKVIAANVVVDKSAAVAAAKAAIDKATAAVIAKVAADVAAVKAATVAKAAAEAQIAAIEAAKIAAAALKSATTTAAAKATATVAAAKAATTAAVTVQAAATAAKAAATAKTAATNASKQVEIAIGALGSKTASASNAVQANAIAAAAKAAADKAAKAAADKAAVAKALSDAANEEAANTAARIATEQKQAADAAEAAKIASDAALKATEEKITAANEAQKSAETVVKALEEKIALAEASVKAESVIERAEIDKKIEEISIKVVEAQKTADAMNVIAEASVVAEEKAASNAELAVKESQVQAEEAIAVRAESVAKSSIATKAAADSSLLAKIATAAKAAAAKVPAKAIIVPKANTPIKKNSAKATISGLKPGQKVKVTVNVKGK